MRRIYIISGILLWLSMSALVVQAGGLNEHESAVVGVARGQFEYNGVTYRAADGYVSELINYLSQDDVDLTAAQRDEAISSIYANVEQGVLEGYIVPIKTDTEEQDQDDKVSNNDGQEQTESQDEHKAKDLIENIVEEPAIITEIDKDAGKITVTDKEDNNILTVNTVIKNTGFNLNTTVILAIGMVIIMALCIIVTLKYQLFAHCDE